MALKFVVSQRENEIMRLERDQQKVVAEEKTNAASISSIFVTGRPEENNDYFGAIATEEAVAIKREERSQFSSRPNATKTSSI